MTRLLDSLPPDLAEPDAAYRAALDWVWSFSARPRGPAALDAQRAAKLDRMRWLLDALGNPQQSYPSLLVAGTKGKGSTVAMLAACLESSGRRTGRYTSPHLVNWRERTCINGQPISPRAVVELTRTLERAIAGLPPGLDLPTTFEVGTALSLLYFAQQQVEVAVLEVGVGGRLDATNLVEPLVSVIAPISYDHTATLGPTLSAIARHKAGILRPDRPGIIAPQPEEARAVVRAEAERIGAPLEEVGPGRDWWWQPMPADPAAAGADRAGLGVLAAGARAPIRITSRHADLPPLEVHLALLGRHQRDNATAAVAALHALGRTRTDLAVGRDDVVAGLANVEWPGRLQILAERPLVVLDGAHNGASAVALREAVQAVLRFARLHLVLGLSTGKDAQGVLEALAPLAATVRLTRARHERSIPPQELAALVGVIAPAASLAITTDLSSALDGALAVAGPDDLVLLTGSLFLVGEAEVWWREHRSSR